MKKKCLLLLSFAFVSGLNAWFGVPSTSKVKPVMRWASAQCYRCVHGVPTQVKLTPCKQNPNVCCAIANPVDGESDWNVKGVWVKDWNAKEADLCS